jgi:phytoene dehydrogenase-like protein
MRDAAREAGAEVRVDAPVTRILVHENKVNAVALQDGSELPAPAVISSADPRRTFLSLMDPVYLDPTFVSRVRNYRCAGSVAKVQLLLDAAPSFSGIADSRDLQERIHIGPSIDYLERAFDASKYGGISSEPYLEAALRASRGGAAGDAGNHVMSVHVQYAPYQLRDSERWEAAGGALLEHVLATLERHAPDIRSHVIEHQVVTPMDLERSYGLTGGHIFQGEQSLDQLFLTRPFLGCAQYRGPVSGLYLCGAGTHPGGGIAGAPGRNAAREVLKDLKAV